jgi:hypothetical protein
MKFNWNTKVVGEAIELVPYRRKFVSNYHQWMLDPDLLEATASGKRKYLFEDL